MKCGKFWSVCWKISSSTNSEIGRSEILFAKKGLWIQIEIRLFTLRQTKADRVTVCLSSLASICIYTDLQKCMECTYFVSPLFPNRLVIWHAILKFILYVCKDLALKLDFFFIFFGPKTFLKVSILCLALFICTFLGPGKLFF